jgi:flagellar biosynthesis protein FliR
VTSVYQFSEPQLLLFFLTLVRMSAFVVTWPVFGVETVAPQVKVLFALLFTMMLFPTLSLSPQQFENVKGDLVLLVAREALIGVCMGYLARLFFFTFRVAGEMIGQAMGLSAAQLFNPSLGGQTTAVEQFYVMLASLFYLAVQGHHFLLMGIASSFEMAPIAILSLNTASFADVGALAQGVIEMGLRFSAPVVISVLVVNLILGVVGKTVPQMNILATSFSVNIVVGVIFMFVSLPLLVGEMGPYLDRTTNEVLAFVESL